MLPRSLARVGALVALLALLAGCSAPAAVQAPAAPEAPPPTSFQRTGPPVGPDLNATTAAAPRLVEGEWWRIRLVSDDPAVVADAELLRVVANATSEGYIFGMPHEGWMMEAIAYHAPAFGDVAPDLSYMTHNERFTPLRFPLVQGATWETKFATGPLVATVESADQHVAVISFVPPEREPTPTDSATDLVGLTGPAPPMRLTYDARVHEVVRMESAIGTWEVVEHGYGFEGWVTVPRGEHTAIDYGTFGPDGDNPGLTREVEVEGNFNRMTVMHFIYALSPGVYRITSTSPAGEQYVTEVAGPAGQHIRFFEAVDPVGTWVQEDLAAGVGATYTMGIAYEQYDILVPDGQRRSSHSHEVVR
jgi:hypothetical protein